MNSFKIKFAASLAVFAFTISAAVAVPPPSVDDARDSKLQISNKSLEHVDKASGGGGGGGDVQALLGRKKKGGGISRKVRRIEKLPPISVSAPMPDKGNKGKHRIVFLMVDFKDRKFKKSETVSYYRKLIFSPRGKSLRTFYKQNSYGKYDVEGDVYGVFHIKDSIAPYRFRPGQPYGLQKMKKLIGKVLAKARGKVPFKKYDVYNKNGEKKRDGVIDHFGIIYPGTYDDIWPHRWGAPGMGAVDGLQVHGYFVQCTASKMGTIIHEYGHDIGLPDLYDTDYSSFGIGHWGTMASGSWGDGGRTPIQMSAWSKTKMGWMKPKLITKTTKNIKLKTSSKYPVALKVPIDSVADKEYFLIENRQRHGFDKFVPNTGILIWHVDETRQGNSDERFKLLDVVEAAPSNELDRYNRRKRPKYTHTYFKGGRDTFGPKTTPGSNRYSGQKTGITIKVTSKSKDTMTLDIIRPKIPNPKGNLVTLDYDNFKQGSFWYFGFGRGMKEAAVKFTPPKGGASVFSLSAGIYYRGRGNNRSTMQFKVYAAKGKGVGKLLYTSPKIKPELSASQRFNLISHSIKKRSGLKVKGDYVVAVTSKAGELGIAATQPSSKHSLRKASTSFSPENRNNYIIRSVAVIKAKGKPAALLATKTDPLVKMMFKADKLTDKKKYRKAVPLYRKACKKMMDQKFRYQEWIAPCANSLGVLAYRVKEYRAALMAFGYAFQMAEHAKAERQMALLHENFGETHYHLNEFKKAEEHISKALELKKKISIEDELLVDSLIWLGKTKKKLGKSDAKRYLQEGLDLAKKLGDKEHIELAEKEL